ncbi:MAG TPA: diguanylate cyclase [Moraxellaceae bacterium]|nr:diguanylate cyclase [Moraxellaceae bacterium]
MSSDSTAASGIHPDEIRKTIAGRVFWCPLAPPADRLFAERRMEEFRHLVYVGWPLLALLWVCIGAGGRWLFADALEGPAGALWWRWEFSMGAALVVPIALLHIRAVQPHYQKVIFVAGSFFLGLAVAGVHIVQEPRLAQVNSYVALLIISILVLPLRLSLIVSGLTSLTGIFSGIGVVLWLGLRVDWPMVTWYCFGTLLVMMFIGAVMERQERISFLQGLLLEHESAERERLNRELARLAQQDGLTHIANRRHFDEALLREWERARREGSSLAILFVDVDYFKPYNDTYGHAAGDECLVAIAAVLANAARRPGDLAARYGGEEFVVILPGTDLVGAREVAERVLMDVDGLALPHAASRAAQNVTVSIGVAARIPVFGEEAQQLLDVADKAVYAAKHGGRHCVVTQPEEALPAA